MENHRKDGGQDNAILEARTIVDSMLPHPANCPNTIRAISEHHLNKKHRLPVMKTLKKYTVSKVIDRLSKSNQKLSVFD